MIFDLWCVGIGKVLKKKDKRVEYERLPNCEATLKEDEMMENTVGLEDGKCYRFRNRADNTIIEVMLGNSNKIVSGQEASPGSENSHQIFEVIEEDSGQFRIALRYGSSAEIQHFWDYLPHRKKLIHKKKSTAESSLQLWRSEKVPGMDTAFYVLSVHNEYCLKSNGKNQQVDITEKQEGDHTQHWRLEVQPF